MTAGELGLLADLANDALLLVSNAGVVEVWGGGAQRMFGHAASEAVGTKLADLLALSNDELARLLTARPGERVHAELTCASNGSRLTVIATAERRDSRIAIALRDVTQERMVAQAVELAPTALVYVDADNNITNVNARARELFGYTTTELVGAPFSLLVPQSRHPIGLRKDGSRFPIELTLSALETAGGIVTCNAIRDVSERERADTLFRGLLESAPDAMLLVDQRGRIELANQQASDMFGYSRAELLGSAVEMLVPARFRDAHSGHRRSYEERPAVRPMGGGGARELFGLRKDGSEFPIEVSLSPLGGSTNLVASAIRDITERRDAERMFRSLLKSAPDAMVVLSADDRLTIINKRAEAMFGFARADLIGRNIQTLFAESSHDDYRRFAENHDHVASLTGVRNGGHEFPIELTMATVETQKGALRTCAIRDVTQHKLLEAELREVSRFKSDLIASLSHELRTPLNAVIGFADLLRTGVAGELAPVQAEYIHDIFLASRHLLQLVNDLLDLARVESGAMDIDVEEVSVSALLCEVRDVLRGVASRKSILLEVLPHPEIIDVMIDSARVKQILFNFVSNAIKFTPAGGKVTLRSRFDADPTRFRLEVEDTGIGIAPGDLDRLFRKFSQINPTDRDSGAGLGLVLSKRIAEVHGGTVEVTSTVGTGSTFTVVLPRASS